MSTGDTVPSPNMMQNNGEDGIAVMRASTARIIDARSDRPATLRTIRLTAFSTRGRTHPSWIPKKQDAVQVRKCDHIRQVPCHCEWYPRRGRAGAPIVGDAFVP